MKQRDRKVRRAGDVNVLPRVVTRGVSVGVLSHDLEYMHNERLIRHYKLG